MYIKDNYEQIFLLILTDSVNGSFDIVTEAKRKTF